MARVTRSKKIEIAEDDTALATQVPLPETPAEKPLAELPQESNTTTSTEDIMDTEVKGLKAAYRTAIGVKKGKKSKNKKKGKQQDISEQQENSSAQDILSVPQQLNGPDLMPDEKRRSEDATEASKKPAVRATRQQLAKVEAADKLATKSAMVEDNGEAESSITEPKSLPQQTNARAGSQSPAKPAVKTLEEVETALAAGASAGPAVAADDSFVEQITCRSPAKLVSRIEDSVEALDQLEEALEAIDQAALTERILSPDKERHKSKTREKIKPEAIRGQKSAKPQLNPKYTTMRVKPTAPKTTVLKRSVSVTIKPASPPLDEEHQKRQPVRKTPVKRPTSLLPPKDPIKSRKPPTLPTKFELPGEAVARKLKEQREARQAQRESSEEGARLTSAPKIKSTKPPTKSTFELPGEAISRRKREAHEARLKVQEEEERRRREFKAKPLRKSVVPDFIPRDTAASRARQSKIGIENMDSGSLSVAKRISNVGAHRPSIAQITSANMSAIRSPGSALERKPSTKLAGPSMSGFAMQRSISSSDVQAQRQRAREIYNRDNKLAEDIERDKKEREAAAKRSREDAAERGRQASREWAEKMRAKRMVEVDKGMGTGYGPGGQMGLRG